VLRDALATGGDATDEALLAERAGHVVQVVEGDPRNMKVTTSDDLAMAEALVSSRAALRIGHGYDLHTLVTGRPLVLGGVTVAFDRGLHGHSDADVVCHALTDAVLGAAGAGDIGRHFPDSDPAWKDANSLELLRTAAALARARGYVVVNVDVTVIAQRPKLAPYVDAMRACLAVSLGCAPADVSVKGKTNEGVDAVGAGEAIAAHAVALLARV
jgi:2-C-methyl-D-erythritol 4-phosphate cytidylyltransferase/2-C-methyl-D-erythritol 2,4-cyclodiphosphate synthase